MARFDLACTKCNSVTVVFEPPSVRIDPKDIKCEFCGSPHLKLYGYYKNSRTQLLELQQQIEYLQSRLESLADEDPEVQNGGPQGRN